jgi:hypothetical protein
LVCSVVGVASPIFCQAGRRCGWNVVARVRGCAMLVCSVVGVASPIFCQAGRRCGWNVVAAFAWVCYVGVLSCGCRLTNFLPSRTEVWVECRCCVCVGVLSWCAQLWVSPHQFSAKQDGGVGGMSLLRVHVVCCQCVCGVGGGGGGAALAGGAASLFNPGTGRQVWLVHICLCWLCSFPVLSTIMIGIKCKKQTSVYSAGAAVCTGCTAAAFA